jgi:hypothetical protein
MMTNGVWHRDSAHLRGVLEQLREAGFSGKIGLSVDKFHGMDIAKLAEFALTARSTFERDNIVSLSYASRSPELGLEPIRKLAEALEGVVEWSEMLGRYLLVSDEVTMTLNWNHLATVERAEALPGKPWDGTWFEEDYCEGPGQALIVNPKGEVKPCCGFASDLDQLTIGNIHTDSIEEIVSFARKHPVVGKIFREGLTALRDDVLQRDADSLPGSTSNHCFFCWYVLSKNLVTVPLEFVKPSASGRVSLPLASADAKEMNLRSGEIKTTLLMAFDGKKVHLAHELTEHFARIKARIQAIDIVGSRAVESPREPLNWAEYQAWIDRLRSEGFALTTHHFSPCRA